MTRTFTGTYDPDKKFSPTKQPHSAIVTQQIPEDDLRRKLYESAAEIEPKEQFGKNFTNTCFSDANSTFINIARLQETMPQPKGKKKKKKKAKEDDPAAEGGDSPDGSPKKKKKKKKKSRVDKDIPEVPPMQYGPEQTVLDAIKRASSWQSCNTI